MSTGVHTEIFQSSGFNISFVWNHQFLCREKLCANYEKEAPAWIRKLTTRDSTWYHEKILFILEKSKCLFVDSNILILIKGNVMICDIKLAEVLYVVIFNFAGFACWQIFAQSKMLQITLKLVLNPEIEINWPVQFLCRRIQGREVQLIRGLIQEKPTVNICEINQ